MVLALWCVACVKILTGPTHTHTCLPACHLPQGQGHLLAFTPHTTWLPTYYSSLPHTLKGRARMNLLSQKPRPLLLCAAPICLVAADRHAAFSALS